MSGIPRDVDEALLLELRPHPRNDESVCDIIIVLSCRPPSGPRSTVVASNGFLGVLGLGQRREDFSSEGSHKKSFTRLLSGRLKSGVNNKVVPP